MEHTAIVAGLRHAGLIGSREPVLVPLSGGVSCDVWKIDAPGGAIVVKRALERLRVAAEWHAPVERAESEVRWLRQVRAIDPRLAPEVLAELPDQHAFALRFVPDAPVWQDRLISGRVDSEFAAQVGRDLVRIHATTANDPAVAAAFRTDDLFRALRIDPFLRHVAAQNADITAPITAIADRLEATRIALVHGDASPKNILVGPDGPIFLDAECAVFGDPAFDLAFCATHLLLKAVWQRNAAITAAATALVDAYGAGISWEARDDVLDRAGALCAALLLARLDGKSPAPYLTDEDDRGAVRGRASGLLHRPQPIDRLVAGWKARP